MKTFTIVGRYEDNGQVFVESYEAKDAIGAADAALSSNTELDEVLSVFAGEHEDLMAPLTDDGAPFTRDD